MSESPGVSAELYGQYSRYLPPPPYWTACSMVPCYQVACKLQFLLDGVHSTFGM